MIHKTFLLGVALIASSLSGHAQNEDEGSKTSKIRGRKAWFLTVAIPKGIDNPVDVQLGNKIQQVTLSLRSMSDAMKIPADGLIRMVKSVPDPNDPTKTIYRNLAQAQIAEGISEAMVICVPTGEKGDGKENGPVFKTRVFDLKDFGGGDSLFLNLSPEKLGVSLGEKKIDLPAGEIGVIDLKDLSESTKMPIGYHIFDKKKKSWSVFSASTVMVRPTRREICIFSWDPNFKRVTFHGVTFPLPSNS